jgi:hypothetical protein
VNPPFEPGYRVVATDNFDWGQDAFLLQDWAVGKRAWVACYSPWKQCAEVIPGAHVLHSHTPRWRVHGWVGISATDVARGWDPWLAAYKPVRALGGTELVYRIPRRPRRRVERRLRTRARAPSAPRPPADGAAT